MSPDDPEVSIVIVNYGTWDLVAEGVRKLLDSIPQGGLRGEIVVVDNHSLVDRREEMAAREPRVRWMRSEGNFGYAHGCNTGARVARAPWLLFMNPDVVAHHDDLRRLLEAARSAEEDALWTAVQRDGHGRMQRAFGPFTTAATFFPLLRSLLRRLAPSAHPDPRRLPAPGTGAIDVGWISGSLMLMSRASFDALDGWDEDYWLYFEDQDLCRRAADLGLPRRFVPGAEFVHYHASSTRSDPTTRVLTRSEAILSRDLYLSKHRVAGRALLRGLMRLQSLIGFALWGVADLLSLGRVRKLTEKRRIQQRLLGHWLRVAKTKDPRSARVRARFSPAAP